MSKFFWIAFRNLLKHRVYSGISIAGLAVGIASFALIAIYIRDELTFDAHHSNFHRTFRVVFDNYLDLGSYATTPLPVGPALKNDFPEVSGMTRVSTGFRSLVTFGEERDFETITFIDSGFFDVFDLQLIAGTTSAFKTDPNHVLLSASLAKKYFGDMDPVGQLIHIGSSGTLNSTVIAVYEDFPQNSTNRFDLALSFQTFEKTWGQANLWQQMPSNMTFITLQEPGRSEDFTSKLPAFVEAKVGSQIEDWETQYVLNIEPMKDIHLRSSYSKRADPSSGMNSIRVLGSISFLLLLIACVNYINYSTSRFKNKVREFSVRRIIGAGRLTLIYQFMAETFTISSVAGLAAYVTIAGALPLFNLISGKAFGQEVIQSLGMTGFIFITVILVTLLAGILPAVFLTGFDPREVLVGNFRQGMAGTALRKALIVCQFTSTVVLIILTAVVFLQMRFVRSNVKPDHVFEVGVFQINDQIDEKFEMIRDRISSLPGVVSVTASSNIPSFYGDSWPVRRTLESEPVQTENYAVENDFLETMGYTLVTGRKMTDQRASDIESGFLINEEAVRRFGFESAESAIGQSLWWGSENPKQGTVVGVIQDFHFSSFRAAIEPVLIQYKPRAWMTNGFIAMRMNVNNYSDINRKIQEIVNGVDHRWATHIEFLSDHFMAYHLRDLQMGRILKAFAILAIFISCLGLLGLAAFEAEQKTREIGIRKVLGASLADILILLTKNFLGLVGFGIFAAVPLSLWIGSNWLDDFAYRIQLPLWLYPVTAVSVIGIALVTVSVQSYRVALQNPVHSLRDD